MYDYAFTAAVTVVLLFCLSAYPLVLRQYRLKMVSLADETNEVDIRMRDTFRRQVLIYLTVFFLSWCLKPVLTLSDGLQEGPSTWHFVLWVFAATTLPVAGFLNAIVYGISRNMWFYSGFRFCTSPCGMCKERRRYYPENGETTRLVEEDTAEHT